MTPIRIFGLAALLLLSACTTPRKPFEAGVRQPPPTAFERADAARAARAPDPFWWRALNDPLLDALVARASRENRDLQAAEPNSAAPGPLRGCKAGRCCRPAASAPPQP